ncbi:thioester domain-containing protein [Actinocorallia herbida]|uniref:thioester domain-containing protein n=1 Tax=Actinocorallia herbida TaxID=58109 RepID=UPI000F4B623E|nr:thioester domain-containing protein [Actinocorallia herbida]
MSVRRLVRKAASAVGRPGGRHTKVGTRASNGGRRGRSTRLLTVCAAATAVILLAPDAAMAGLNPVGQAAQGRDLLTEATITGTGAGTAVPGFIAPVGFDPLAGYPATIPTGSTAHNASFAGLIRIADPVSGRTGLTYCIDLETDTQIGVNYELGDWTEANVPNLGYVEYILLHYFPTTGEPASAANDNIRAAAVQAAIWYFSDRFLVATTSTAVLALVQQIVSDALANGPSPEPVEPELEVMPETMDAPSTGEIVGPFRVSGTVTGILRTNGVAVFTDAEGRNALVDGAEVAPGTSLWARSASATSPPGFVLERVSTILTGTVLLYDGTNPDLEEAQKLILAQQAELVVRAGAELNRFAAGALELTKTIAGAAAGLQGRVVVRIECVDEAGGRDRSFTAVFPRRASAGSHPRTFSGIPAGSACTVTETATGDNALVDIVGDPEIEPVTVTIVANETAEVSVTDTYARATGDLEVVKKISGPGAGRQGAIVLALDCTADGFDRTFTIPAGTPAGIHRQPVVTGIPTRTRCRVRETETGENADVESVGRPRIHPRTVEIREKGTNRIVVEDRYVKRHRDGHRDHEDDWFDRLAFDRFVFGHRDSDHGHRGGHQHVRHKHGEHCGHKNFRRHGHRGHHRFGRHPRFGERTRFGARRERFAHRDHRRFGRHLRYER